MAYLVGPKGQVVISKEIRDHLGIKPGWVALQQLVEDRVLIYFLPPEHRQSLKGSLSSYINIHVEPGDNWEGVRREAWEEAARVKESDKG